jgi:hypothetical protein
MPVCAWRDLRGVLTARHIGLKGDCYDWWIKVFVLVRKPAV